MILEPLLGLSLALTVSRELQPPPAAGANVLTHTAVRQKGPKLLPLVHRTTDCIVRKVFADPCYNAGLRPGEINDLIVDSMLACVGPVRSMIEPMIVCMVTAPERRSLGPYLDFLPAAVVGQVKTLEH